MKKKLFFHPLWTHLPALLLIVYFCVRLVLAGQLPYRVPTHFSFNGQPDAWGSPWLVLGLNLGLSLVFLAVSLVMDESWARAEKHKSFNWISLLDELTVGSLIGLSLGYLDLLEEGRTTFNLPFVTILVTVLIMLALALVLEWLRPFRPNPRLASVEDISRLQQELREKLRSNQVLVYWQSQNPLWLSFLTVLLPLFMLAVAVMLWFSLPWLSLLYFALTLGFGLMHGGMRTLVTRDRISVRLGLPGFKVLNIRNSEIAGVEIMEFSPIKDFGGYGIRYRNKMFAYYLNGRRGIKITLKQGMQYLIGSDHPEQMLAVIKAVISDNPQ
jgi:hypothetical protein